MVEIIQDWDVLQEYVGEKLGFYRVIETDGKHEIRVQTGRAGFRQIFEKGDDPLLLRIKEFCKNHGFIQITGHIRDEDFFR